MGKQTWKKYVVLQENGQTERKEIRSTYKKTDKQTWKKYVLNGQKVGMTLRGHLMTDVSQEHPSFSTQTFFRKKKSSTFLKFISDWKMFCEHDLTITILCTVWSKTISNFSKPKIRIKVPSKCWEEELKLSLGLAMLLKL
jgi:hypothetical protein